MRERYRIFTDRNQFFDVSISRRAGKNCKVAIISQSCNQYESRETKRRRFVLVTLLAQSLQQDRNLLQPDILRLRTKRLRRDSRIGAAERGRIVSRGFR